MRVAVLRITGGAVLYLLSGGGRVACVCVRAPACGTGCHYAELRHAREAKKSAVFLATSRHKRSAAHVHVSHSHSLTVYPHTESFTFFT